MFLLKNVVVYSFVLSSIAVYAQNDKSSFQTLAFTNINYKPQDVNYKLTKQKPFLITIDQPQTSIPKFFQFICEGNASTLTVQINITDGINVQTITREVKIDTSNKFYEVLILPRNRNDINLNSNSYIKSVLVVNDIDEVADVKSCNFSNVSIRNEVNVNQVFMVDLDAEVQKRYMVFSRESKTISMNVYKANGELEEHLMYTLNTGENYLDFSLMKKKNGKKVVQLSDDLQKKPTNKISVMF